MKTSHEGFDHLSQAIKAGDIDLIQALIESGVDLHARDSNGYDALISAAFTSDDRLMPVLSWLVSAGAAQDGVSKYKESALSVVSRRGRFDAVRLLLEAGAPESLLAWTALIRATAIGSIDEMLALIDAGTPLEGQDRWSRTAWLIAVHMGDLKKARLLSDRGADVLAVGFCERPALLYAIESRNTAMVQWLLEQGHDIEQTDKFGSTALIEAAACGDVICLDILIAAGAQIDRVQHGGTALSSASSRAAIMRLLAAGADEAYLSQERQRILLGLNPGVDMSALDPVTPKQFLLSRSRCFGARNPQLINDPVWLAMIRAGVNGYMANKRFAGPSSFDAGPVWCAQRFGQSMTIMPDGRIVQIGGEHEDSYDPDFCIYNDVFVHATDGSISIYGYPEPDFAPTDFHSATACGDAIIIIGSLGYKGRRQYGHTPVYWLDTRTWRIARVETQGAGPGWIHKHRAALVGPTEIHITGGRVLTMNGARQETAENASTFVLDIARWVWSRRDAT